MFTDAIALCLSPFLWALEWMARVLSTANALPAFLAIFAASVVSRLIIKPLVGEQSAVRAENKSSSKKGD